MEKTKLANELLEGMLQEKIESEAPNAKGAIEIRTLNELELMVTSGGDAIVCW